MEYVSFGNSGLKVSRMALGLGLRDQHDEKGAERLIHRAVDRGINLFDCANVYGLGDDRAFIGKSEEILGRALQGKRDDVVITSKVASPIGPGPNDRGTSRYSIMREVERSVARRADTLSPADPALLTALGHLHREDTRVVELRLGLHGGPALSEADTARVLGIEADEELEREEIAVAKLRHPCTPGDLTHLRQL